MSKPVVDIVCEHHGPRKTCRGCGKCAPCCGNDFICCGLKTLEERKAFSFPEIDYDDF